MLKDMGVKPLSSGLSRRTMLVVGQHGGQAFFSADAGSPVAYGILANNPLALAFESAASELPDVTLMGLNGERYISELKGHLLMPLWAEWCAPCMGEIPDFARLQLKYGNEKFAIVPVLTGPHKQVTPAVITQMFTYLHASVFEPLMENHLGNILMQSMARRNNKTIIPCNLLIAPDGHVVAREFGLQPRDEDDHSPAQPMQEKKPSLIARAEAGDSLSLWGQPAGDEFASAMANGFLG